MTIRATDHEDPPLMCWTMKTAVLVLLWLFVAVGCYAAYRNYGIGWPW